MSVWKLNKCKTLLILLYGTVDLTVTSILYGRSQDYRTRFSEDVGHYTFSRSLFELWVFAIARTSLMFGCLLGLLCGRSAAVSLNRLDTAGHLSLCFSTFSCGFAVMKFLAYSEAPPSGPHVAGDAWFWALFSWTFFAGLLLCVSTHALKKFTLPVTWKASLSTERDALISFADYRDGGDRHNLIKDDNINDNESGEVRPNPLRRLARFSAREKMILMTSVHFMLNASAAAAFIPFYVGDMIQSVISDKDWSKFTNALIYLAILSIISSVTTGVHRGLTSLAVERLSASISGQLFSSILKQELAFFDTTKTGELVSRLMGDTGRLAECLELFLEQFFKSLLTILGLVIYMFVLSWRLALVVAVGFPVIIIILHLRARANKTTMTGMKNSNSHALACDAISSIQTVKTFAGEMAEGNLFDEKLTCARKRHKRKPVRIAAFVIGCEVLTVTMVIGAMYYGGHLYFHNLIEVGALISFIIYLLAMENALQRLYDSYPGVMEAMDASGRIFQLIDRKPECKDYGFRAPEHLSGKVEFKNVTFNYPSRPGVDVLQDVSFTIKAGEVVALVGPTGGGKTTILNLLQHFYEPNSGEVLLDDVPMHIYDNKYLHKKVVLVGQETELLERSITENIAYGLDYWDDMMVQRAAEKAQAHRAISAMTEGYTTHVGARGRLLSAGQKQKIVLARALIRNPTVVLLDDVTSAMDAESEHVVQKALFRNLVGKTVVMVTSRLSAARKADRIIVVHRGALAEQGTHEELLLSGGHYSRLARRQLLLTQTSGGSSTGEEKADDLSTDEEEISASFKSLDSSEALRSSREDDWSDGSLIFGTPK